MTYKRSHAGNRSSSQGSPEKEADILRTAEEFLHANLCNPVAVADIAAAAGLRVRALQRLFRSRHAATPMRVLLNLRIEAARDIIQRGDASSVRDVAAQLQFSNPSRFSKFYRKIHSCIPSQDIRQRQQDAAAIQPDRDQ